MKLVAGMQHDPLARLLGFEASCCQMLFDGIEHTLAWNEQQIV